MGAPVLACQCRAIIAGALVTANQGRRRGGLLIPHRGIAEERFIRRSGRSKTTICIYTSHASYQRRLGRDLPRSLDFELENFSFNCIYVYFPVA